MNYIVSVPVNENLASFIGKKGSDEGIAFFNRKLDTDTIVAIMPANKEDKMYYSMAETMLISGQIAISTESVDKLLGEVIVAASLLEKHVIILNDNDISKITNNMFRDAEVCGRAELLDRIVSRKEQHDGDARIDIDKAFPVKGIGTVVLGVVTRGMVKVHDTMYHSSGKQLTIKSIQSQDVDVLEAGYGTRVGLAIKGLEYDQIDKGDLFLPLKFQKAKAVDAAVKVSSFANEKIEAGSRYVFVSNFSYTVCKVEQIDKDIARISLEKPLSVLEGDSFMLVKEKSPRIFASGKINSVY
ncbi:MAG: EF-Tu/IF-2/RF-3 family GTPase [Candidatus Micrarchaeaceae archaeon]